MADDPSSPETRSSLLERVRALDPESWDEFVKLYEPLLLAYARDCDRRYGLVLDGHDREDVKQEVLIKLYHTLPSFQLDRVRRGRFRTWLWKVTHNAVIDWVRRHRRGAPPGGEGPRPLHVRLTPDLDEQLAADTPAPDEQLIQEHLWHVLRHILQKVQAETPDGPRWPCFERHFLQRTPSAQVAAELGLSVGAVNTNTSRVLARVRELCRYYDVEL